MSRRHWHHYFHGEGIDMAKVHEEANAFLTDYKSPRSSLVHDHPHDGPCDGKDHWAYDHETGRVIAFEADPAILQQLRDTIDVFTVGAVENAGPMGNGLRSA